MYAFSSIYREPSNQMVEVRTKCASFNVANSQAPYICFCGSGNWGPKSDHTDVHAFQ